MKDLNKAGAKGKKGFGAGFFFLLLFLCAGLMAAVPAAAGEASLKKAECTVRYYNSTGSSLLFTEKVTVGKKVKLHASPYTDKQKYRGWVIYEGTEKKYLDFGAEYTFSKDKNVFLQEYMKLAFKNDYNQTDFTRYVRRGNTTVLPYPTGVPDYTSEGWWVRNSDGSTTGYLAKQTIKADRDMTLYAVRRYTPYEIRFADNSGKLNNAGLMKLNLKAGKETIVLPELPYWKDHMAVGWSLKKKSTSAEYFPGDKVSVRSSMTFCAVYRKARDFSLSFCMLDGSVPASYKSLNQTVKEGSTFVLPQIPEREGYLNTGWRITLNGVRKVFQPGDRILVLGNYVLRSLQEQSASVTLRYNSGTLIKTITVKQGSAVTLPCIASPAGYTFMGWSTKRFQQADPLYEAQEILPSVTGNLVLYPVLYDRSRETATELPLLDEGKYSQVILVGDSRMYYTQLTLSAMGISDPKIRFVCRSGQGLSWFCNAGYDLLADRLTYGRTGEELPSAVVFNFGVNDLWNSAQYVSYMNKIAPELMKMNCRLFYMSVNPVCSESRKNYIARYASSELGREEKDVREFNRVLKAGLSKDYTYLDMYQALRKRGYVTTTWSTSSPGGTWIDDGLHYSRYTSLWILGEVLQRINLL